MLTVTVGRFHDDAIGALGRVRVANDWQSPTPDVPRKYEAPLGTTLGALENDRGRAQNVTSVDKGGTHIGRDVEWLVVRDGNHALHYVDDIFLTIEGRFERPMLSREV